MIRRESKLDHINFKFEINPAVAILGPRQCGKTSLAREYKEYYLEKSKQEVHYFDLEKFDDYEILQDAHIHLSNLSGLIIIDEIQKMPNLFQTMRVLIDDKKLKQKYLILGSASRDLLNQSAETLAGRIGYIELTPFDSNEVDDLHKLWLRGGYPLSYLAESEAKSNGWRTDYISTFLNKDIPALGIKVPPRNLQRFWLMLSNYHGNIGNYQNLATSLSLSANTIKKYLDILESTFMIRQLQPWFENISKRQVKSPKLYIKDSGILHSLLSIENYNELIKKPILGASWEGFMLEEIIRAHKMTNLECFFWRTHTGVELDLLFVRGLKKVGFEFKYGQSVKLTNSMKVSMESLKLEKLYVIYPGDRTYTLDKNIIVTNLKDYLKNINSQ